MKRMYLAGGLMRRPVIGITGNSHLIDGFYPAQTGGLMSINAIVGVCDSVAIIIPSIPENACVEELMEICDGFLFTGARPNVHPKFYGEVETEEHGAFDLDRDEISLKLISSCVKEGKPILGVCRGFQEFNVAMGGTLHPEIKDLPGRINHRMPKEGTIEDKFGHKHSVSLSFGGEFERIFESNLIMVNSLHGQGIKDIGRNIVIEGFAPDGTPEALFVDNVPGFAMAVQWHPEWNAEKDIISRKLFRAFRDSINL